MHVSLIILHQVTTWKQMYYESNHYKTKSKVHPFSLKKMYLKKSLAKFPTMFTIFNHSKLSFDLLTTPTDKHDIKKAISLNNIGKYKVT